MSRTAQPVKNKIIIIIVAIIVIATVIVALVVGNYRSSANHSITTLSAQQTSNLITYKGQNGQTALALLKKYDQVQTKHYSFGDFVTSINGKVGNGPKYWTFYVNGKEASVGAGTYITKNGDTIEWKLQ